MIGKHVTNQVSDLLSVISDPDRLKSRIERLQAETAKYDKSREDALKAVADLKDLKAKEADLVKRERVVDDKVADIAGREEALRTGRASLAAERDRFTQQSADAQNKFKTAVADHQRKADAERKASADARSEADRVARETTNRLNARQNDMDSAQRKLDDAIAALHDGEARLAAKQKIFDGERAEHAARLEKLRSLVA